MLLILVVIGVSCSGYESFIQLEGDASFSFQYPVGYENSVIDIYPENTRVGFSRPLQEKDWRCPVFQKDSWFDVSVYSAGRFGDFDARAAVESYIARLSKRREFKLLGRSSVSVAGVVGEQVKCSFIEHPDDYPFGEGPLETTTIVCRHVYFDYGGFIWDIGIRCHEEVAEADMVGFERILKTFRIIGVKEQKEWVP